MLKILVSGGDGRFANELKKINSRYKFIFRNKRQLNILSVKSIINNFNKFKPDYFLHLAGLSRPMSIHDKMINKSIDLNIIGTANITKACKKYNIKLIYFSTHYVYPGKKGNYSEEDPLLPINNYSWSKLGGEASVQLYKNSLILRACMTEKPFIHREAFTNVKTSFIYQDDVAELLSKLLREKGIINLGGKTQFIYDFAKKSNKYVRKKILKKNSNLGIPFNSSLNISKLKKILQNSLNFIFSILC